MPSLEYMLYLASYQFPHFQCVWLHAFLLRDSIGYRPKLKWRIVFSKRANIFSCSFSKTMNTHKIILDQFIYSRKSIQSGFWHSLKRKGCFVEQIHLTVGPEINYKHYCTFIHDRKLLCYKYVKSYIIWKLLVLFEV